MVQWGPIGREVYERTYSRKRADGTKEEWADTVQRVIEGNCALVPGVLGGEVSALKHYLADFKAVPAGRHLWVSGVPGRQFLFNCHRAGWTPELADHFGFVFDELMKGGGVGANYSNVYMERARVGDTAPTIGIVCDLQHPDYNEVAPDRLCAKGLRLIVPDSREGWVIALKWLVDTHQDGVGGDITFDVSEVRPRGSEIKGFGGTASGPGPLADMLRGVHAILTRAAGRQLTSLESMEVDHHIASCVIAGNVRRSARMSIKHWADYDIFDFINCKADHASHWTTNISVEIDDAFFTALRRENRHAVDVLYAVAEGMVKNGEPGFFNSAYAAMGEHPGHDVRCTNPCGEIALEEWENCNLGHLNLAALEDWDELVDAARLMTRYLIRATFGDIGSPLQQAVVARNRRIGVGLFGFQEWVIKQFGIRYSECWKSWDVQSALTELRRIIREEADRYAGELGVPAPIKVTTVAPTGTIAKMPGTSEGIHPIYAKYFIRRVRYAADHPELDELTRTRYSEPCIYSANTTVVEFICRDQIFDTLPEDLHHLVESVEDITLDDMLRVQAMVQSFWADNAVSFTVNFPMGDYTADDVVDSLWEMLPHVKGTTLMPDGSRPQAPYERKTQQWYEAMRSGGESLDSAASFDDCANGACPVR